LDSEIVERIPAFPHREDRAKLSMLSKRKPCQDLAYVRLWRFIMINHQLTFFNSQFVFNFAHSSDSSLVQKSESDFFRHLLLSSRLRMQ
jgi:hypothetical protein